MKPFALLSSALLLALTGCAVYPTYDNLGHYPAAAPGYAVSASYGYAPAYVAPPVYVRPSPYYYRGGYSHGYRGGYRHYGPGWRH